MATDAHHATSFAFTSKVAAPYGAPHRQGSPRLAAPIRAQHMEREQMGTVPLSPILRVLDWLHSESPGPSTARLPAGGIARLAPRSTDSWPRTEAEGDKCVTAILAKVKDYCNPYLNGRVG